MINQKRKLLSADEIMQESEAFASQCRATFTTISGSRVLKRLKKIYCNGNLYGQDDRSTAYMLGQRDLVLELVSHIDELESVELVD